MKTCIEWYDYAEAQGYDWAGQALRNWVVQQKRNRRVDTLSNAIYHFDWS